MMLQGLLILVLCGTARSAVERSLSLEKICNYEPQTVVTDQNAIAYDQQELERYLAMKSNDGFDAARRIYEVGAHSKSSAILTLPNSGLPTAIAQYASVEGVAVDGSPVQGFALYAYKAGATEIVVQYNTIEIQESYSRCQVGASLTPILDGCFAANGTVVIAGAPSAPVPYTYDPAADNLNQRTIQGLSTYADERMRPDADSEPFLENFRAFVSYYGFTDYGDEWIVAAFEANTTNFLHGNADFSKMKFDGRGEAIRKGTAFLNILGYMIRDLDLAVYECHRECTDNEGTSCDQDRRARLYSLDKAVAFWAGATEGTNCEGDGHLMAQLADNRCVDFNTCGQNSNDADGTAYVNLVLLDHYQLMQDSMIMGDCVAATVYKSRIVKLLRVPLVQSILKYAYMADRDYQVDERIMAEGATFAATLLPILHQCSAQDAQTLHYNTYLGGLGSFAAVRRVLERNYDCLGVTCAEVGGLYFDAKDDYYPGAHPCSSDTHHANAGKAVGISLIVAVIVLVSVWVLRRKLCKVDEREYP